MCYASNNGRAYIDSIHVGKLLMDSGIDILVNEKRSISIRDQQIQIAGLADIYSKNDAACKGTHKKKFPYR